MILQGALRSLQGDPLGCGHIHPQSTVVAHAEGDPATLPAGLPACSLQDTPTKVQVQLPLSPVLQVSTITSDPARGAPNPEQKAWVSICWSLGSSLITKVLALPMSEIDWAWTELIAERLEFLRKAFQPTSCSAVPLSGHEVPSPSCRKYKEPRGVSVCSSALPSALMAEAPQQRVGMAREAGHAGWQLLKPTG